MFHATDQIGTQVIDKRYQEEVEWRKWQAESGDQQLTTRSVHQSAIATVIRTIQARLHEPLSLEDMADMAYLSPYYFCRVFHQLVGVPPGEFLSTLRLNTAKRLVLTTSLSITDICFDVGYVGLGSFTTRFTQLVGVPPRQLRQLAGRITPPSLPKTPVIRGSDVVQRGVVRGYIRTNQSFHGLIYVGLFPKPIPQGRPLHCTLVSSPGVFCIDSVPDGRYFLLTAALPISNNPYTYLLPDDQALVGSYGPIIVYRGIVHEQVDVLLRRPKLTDPPIITALPFI